MRQTAAILLLITPGGFLLGCGTSARLDTRSTHAARPDPTHTADARTIARARNVARALNLRASDLPGFTRASEPTHETLADRGIGAKLERCTSGRASREALAEVSSSNFEHQARLAHASVSSSVRILATPAQATAEVEALRGGHTRTCLPSFVHELLAGEMQSGASAKLVAIKGETPYSAETSGTFAWSIAGQLTLHGVTARFYVELAGFAFGRAKVELLSFGVPLPFPARAERDLFSLLISRAKAGGKGVKPEKRDPRGTRRVQISYPSS